MYQYTYLIREELNVIELQEKISEKEGVLIFRLKNDFISQLTIERLLEDCKTKNVNIIDVQVGSNIKVIGEFHLERLPKFYFYNKGKIFYSISGNMSKTKLENLINELLF